jgi:hypothetical protein
MNTRLTVLEQSLLKKEAAFDAKLDQHFSSVKATNGQPLNDKRNGAATMRRFESQNDSLRKAKDGIERTKNAIERERDKIAYTELVADTLPQVIKDRLADGTLEKWRKHPTTFFVVGVDKARIVVLDDGKTVAHRYLSSITDPDQRRIFARTFNALRALMQKPTIDAAIASQQAGGKE